MLPRRAGVAAQAHVGDREVDTGVAVAVTRAFVELLLGSDAPPAVIDAADLPIAYGAPESRLGHSVAAGELNGDGYGDALLAGPEQPDRGVVYVVFGGADGAFPDNAGEADAAIEGPTPTATPSATPSPTPSPTASPTPDGEETVEEDVSPGGTASTDDEGDGATPDDTVETSVTSPNGGTVSITETTVTEAPPTGFSFFGQQVNIEAPDATAEDPLVLTFVIDASILPGGGVAAVEVFKDGVRVADCTGAPQAIPDPCVSSRTTLPDGDGQIVVLTSTASAWNFGASVVVPDCDGRYETTLTSPALGEKSKTFSWTVDECKPHRDIHSVKLSGCWDRRDIKDVDVSSGRVKIFHDGTIRIHQIDNDDLPLDITIRFDKKYKAGDHEVDVFVKEQGPGHGSFFKVDYDKADGPDCKPHGHPWGWWWR